MRPFRGLLAVSLIACGCSSGHRVPDTSSNTDAAGLSDAGSQDGGRHDAGVSDGGSSVSDAGDAGSDAGKDGGVNLGPDAGTDAGVGSGWVSPYPNRWGAPEAIAGLNTAANELNPAVSEDTLRICFSSDRAGGAGGYDIYCARRDNTTSPFGPAENQTGINSTGKEWHTFFWQNEFYFSSDLAGSMDIYRADWDASSGSYVNPVAVNELNSSAWDSAPALAADGLTLFFESARGSATFVNDIYVTTRPSTHEPFTTPVKLAAVNSSSDDWAPSPAPDLSFLMFSSPRPGAPTNSLAWWSQAAAGGGWQAPVPLDVAVPIGFKLGNVRPLPDGTLLAHGQTNSTVNYDLYIVPPGSSNVPPSPFAWGVPVPLPGVNTSANETQPTMTADLRRLCFTSDRSGGLGGQDIWCASRSSARGVFGAAANQTAINSAGNESRPALSPDGTELFFISDQQGTFDIYSARWNPVAGDYESPRPVAELNSSAQDFDPGLSNDALLITFSSDRPGGLGGADIYMSLRADRMSAFSAPTGLTDLSSIFNDYTPTPTYDGFGLTFCSDRPTAGESGLQPLRMWGASWLGGGHWSVPVLVSLDSYANVNVCAPTPLSDGSLMFQGLRPGAATTSDTDLFVAPPKAH
jgi:Tol biopolymer transport system component